MTLREQGVPGEHEEAAGEEGERPARGQQGADREHQEESCFSSKFSSPDYFFFSPGKLPIRKM